METDKEQQEATADNLDKTTSDYLTGLEERENLKVKLKELQTELNKAKGQNYDLLKKCEALEEKIQTQKQDADGRQRKKTSRPSTGKVTRKPAERKEPRKKQLEGSKHEQEMPNGVFETTEKLYEFIAQKFPDLPLSTILKAEKKFTEADIDGNGTVDAKELEAMLDSTDLLFTKAQVQEIMTAIDVDNTASVDFIECLTILDQLRANRRTALPQSIQQQRSTICTVQ